MTGYLLDRDVLSELRRPKSEPKVVAFVAAQLLDDLFVSELTLAEIRFGIEGRSRCAETRRTPSMANAYSPSNV